MERVVQLEFFHVGGNTRGDLEALDAELAERIATGSPIKTVVRLYDEGQCIVRFIKKWQVRHRYLRRMDKQYEEALGLRRICIGVRYSRFLREYSDEEERKERLLFAQTFFADQIDEWEDMAIEIAEHFFRPVKDDEVYDLRVAASKAKGVWIYVFAPNDLCAETNKNVAQATI